MGTLEVSFTMGQVGGFNQQKWHTAAHNTGVMAMNMIVETC